MKKFLIVILALGSISAFGQKSLPTGLSTKGDVKAQGQGQCTNSGKRYCWTGKGKYLTQVTTDGNPKTSAAACKGTVIDGCGNDANGNNVY